MWVRKHILFFTKTERIKVYTPFIAIEERNMPILDCDCWEQRCHGKYIKTRDYQTTCMWDTLIKEQMIREQKYKVVMPNTEFPLYSEYEKFFELNDDTIFAYNNTIYTSNELPDHLLEHEKTHLRQQNTIGSDNWVVQYLRDTKFRLGQEVEAYKNQLKAVKDRNAKAKLKVDVIRALCSPLYGNMVAAEDAKLLINE